MIASARSISGKGLLLATACVLLFPSAASSRSSPDSSAAPLVDTARRARILPGGTFLVPELPRDKVSGMK